MRRLRISGPLRSPPKCGLADFVPPSPESLARLRAIIDEAFG
jgi:hypothetical protein